MIVSTRPINLDRGSGAVVAALRQHRHAACQGRVFLLNAAQGDLTPLFQTAEAPMRNFLQYRLEQRPSGAALEPGTTSSRPGFRRHPPVRTRVRTTHTDGEAWT